MLTKELTQKIAKATGMTRRQSDELMAATTRCIMDALRDEKQVQLWGLGVLEVKETNQRTVVHPKTGERSTVPAGKKLSFRPTVTLKGALK